MLVSEINNATQTSQTTDSTKTTKTSDASFSAYMSEAEDSTDTTSVTLDEIFEKAAEKYDVPVNLLKAIGYAESSFNPNATSSCGAQGIMQLMPSTAASLGVTDAYDPEQNIMGGAKYISGLLDKYDGDTTLALAAYNAGSGNVAKYGGVPPFAETQNYVVKVLNYMNQDLSADTEVTVSNSNTSSSSGVWSGTFDTSYTPVFDEDDTSDVTTTQDKLDQIFSYDTYELFLKLYGQDDDESKEEQSSDNSLSQINMSPTVANLLKSMNA